MGHFNEQTLINEGAYNEWRKAVSLTVKNVVTAKIYWQCECGAELPDEPTYPEWSHTETRTEVMGASENADGTFTPDDSVTFEETMFFSAEWECRKCGRVSNEDELTSFVNWGE